MVDKNWSFEKKMPIALLPGSWSAEPRHFQEIGGVHRGGDPSGFSERERKPK